MSQEQLGTRNFVQIGLFGGIFWAGMVFPSYIFIHGGGPELFPFTICVWKLERGCMGQCVRNSVYGTSFNFDCLLYKAFLQSLKGL